MNIYNPFAGSQSDAVAGHLPAVQTPERHKNSVGVFGIESLPVVMHGQQPRITLPLRCKVNERKNVRPAELDRIADQVLQQLHHNDRDR